jgi:hypothetical protein
MMTKIEKLSNYQISWWQIGCNEAKAGKPFDLSKRLENGYAHGYFWGQHGRAPLNSELEALFQIEKKFPGRHPDPPLPNPYMEAMEAVEGILQRLQTFTKEFPEALDEQVVQDYRFELLAVRDKLSTLRKDEIFVSTR